MSISTDSYQNIEYNENTVSQIGLSKTLDNYTWDEIFNFQYCSMCNGLARIVAPYAAQTNITSYDETKLAFTVTITDSWDGDADFYANGTGVYNYPQGLYSKIIWLRGTRTETNTYQLYNSNMGNFKLVTDWDAPNFIFTIPQPISTFGDCANDWSDDETTVKTTWDTDTRYGSLSYRYRHDGTYSDISISGNVMPYLLYKHNGHYYCQQLRQTSKFFGATIDKSGNDAKVGVNNLIYPVEDTTVNSLSFFGGNVASDGFYYNTDRTGTAYNPWDGNYKQTIKKYAYCNLDNNDCMGRFAYAGTSPSQYCGLETFFRTKRASLMFWAGCGVKFYADKLYKPIISDGFVTDFTDDMLTASDLDNWSGGSNHTVPDAPPAPPSPESHDNEIDVDTSQFAPSIGFVNYIEMDYETAIHVASAFNAYNASIWNVGGDLFKNLISYKIFAMYGSHSGTIKNISIAGHELEYNESPINGNYIDDMGVVDLGSITVGSKFKFNDWRDFAPYTKIECFVPCCGWCQLPPWVMGRTVTGTIYIDLANGSCKALIFASKTPVAEIGGCCAIDVPFSSVATGAKAAGIIGAITNGAVAAFNPTPQNLISGSFGILSALNANYTETKGVMGDGSNINGCTQFLIKVTRPASTDTGNGEITNAYKHEKGLPCGKTITLAKGDGFTQITDAKITGAMTAREKQMIVDGFRHGLIL